MGGPSLARAGSEGGAICEKFISSFTQLPGVQSRIVFLLGYCEVSIHQETFSSPA